MKKWFTFPKITIIVVAFAVCLAVYSKLMLKNPVLTVSPNKQEVQAFVENTLPKIIKTWNIQELEPLLYPGIMDNASWANAVQYMQQVVGPCEMGKVQWKESQRQSHIKWSGVMDRSPVVFHGYLVNVKCKNPKVEGLFVIVSDNFKYAGFHSKVE